jgi:hypothetical protein
VHEGVYSNPFTLLIFGREATRFTFGIAGWSSPVARQAHNLKVAGSNPAPATRPRVVNSDQNKGFGFRGLFCVSGEGTVIVR